MSSARLPKAARGAVFVALVIALVSGISVRSGPIMLLGVCLVALLAAAGIFLRRVWSAWGFAMLLACAIVAMLFFAITGQGSGSFLQALISVGLYGGIACLFVLAGLSLKVEGAKMGWPAPWILIALCFSVPFILYVPVSVPNGAMENTLLPGDFLLVDRFSGAHAAMGDLVAFHNPKDWQQILIRRVAGVPGSVVNGSVIPAGKYYVLGDAPGKSVDSRNFGFVDAAAIVGKPKFVYDSLAPDPADLNAQSDLAMPTHPPTRRWERVFKAL
jgi:signal peptidase I